MEDPKLSKCFRLRTVKKTLDQYHLHGPVQAANNVKERAHLVDINIDEMMERWREVWEMINVKN